MSIGTLDRSYAPARDDAARALRTALSRGGEWAELFWERHRILSLLFDDGRLEEAIAGTDQGAGIRVRDGEHTVFANGNVTDADDLMTVAGRAAAGVAAEESEPRHEVGALEEMKVPSPSVVAIDPRDVPVERKVALLLKADATARAHDPRITQVTASYREFVQDVVIANSDGRYVTDRRVRLTFAVSTVARAGDLTQTGYESLGGTVGFEMMTEEATAEVARTAARRAILNLEADPAPAGTFTVVLSSEAGGTLIHESVGHGLEADLNDRGMSVYAGKIGEKVASELITVVDDGRLAGKRGTAAVDDEGTSTQRTVLIEKGVLRTYLTDRKHAPRVNVPLSGNARRESFRHLPICRMTNTMIEPGTSDPEEILRSVKDGIFVRKMGGGQVDVVSGSFAFEITEGYRIKDGRLDRPIRGATLVGEGPKIMREIDMVGSDLGFSIGTCGKDGQGAPVADAQPTIRIPAIVIGGVVQQ